jgi:hypothetical protein
MTRSLFAGLAFLIIGISCLFIENIFYQYLDEDGVLHESFFMPLGALFLALGVLMLCYLVVKKLITLTKGR